MSTKLTDAEQKELAAIEERRLHWYVGFNVIRHTFRERADAERYMALKVKAGADQPVFYGSMCAFAVTATEFGGAPAYEFAEG